MRKKHLPIKAALLALLATAIAISCTMTTRAKSITEAQTTPEEDLWIDSVYRSLTPRQRVAQLFVPHVITTDNAAGRAKLKSLVADHGVGGILLGKATIGDYARLNDFMQQQAAVPLMITLDGEWGPAMRLSDAPRFPHNIAIGAGDDLEAVRQYGREVARECRALGITVNFAPVADVNSNPDNPVIGYRSFGEDPKRVAAMVREYSRGLQEGGVIAVAKHFPGHGDTSTDSHHTLPVVDRSRTELDNIDLLPFKNAIADGIDGVMVGHLTVKALDPTGRPTSLSKPVITGLLKNEMGFDGLIFTDALEMSGAQMRGENNCVLALEAGADILLGSASPATDIDAVMNAISSGRLDPASIEARVRKVLRYKYRLGLDKRPTIDVANAASIINNAEATGVAERLGRMAVTILRDDKEQLPLRPNRPVKYATVGGSDDNDFVKECKRLDATRSTVDMEAGTAPVVLAPVFSGNASAVSTLQGLVSRHGDALIPVFFMNPYKVKAFASVIKDLPTVVIVGDDTRECRLGAAQAVFGTINTCGRLPVNVRGVGRAGDGVSRQRILLGHLSPEGAGARPGLATTIDGFIDTALANGAFPGCQVMVVKDGNIIYERNAGYIDRQHTAPVTGETLYDLASVSKVAGTMAGLMAAYDDGLFSPDDPLEEHVAALKGDPKGRLTLKRLMFHESGLPAGLNYYRFALDTATYNGRGLPGSNARLRQDIFSDKKSDEFPLTVAEGIYATAAARDSMWAAIHRISPSGSAYKYSDLNFCLLMEAEEQMTGAPHEEWFEEYVAAPLGNTRTLYWPRNRFPAEQIAATENDTHVRRQLLRGYVHDETAAFSGGVQGNAGLFSNAEGLARWCQMLLDDGWYGGLQLLDPETVRLFLNTRSASGGRGLGFDVSGSFVGHTGFTGTCFWIDPKRDITVIVLTNRVNPTRENQAWRTYDPRRRILNAVDAAFH